MFDTRHHLISRFGTMHLVAVNLITWFQYLLIKTESTSTSLGKVYKINKTIAYYIATTTATSSSESSEEMEDDAAATASNDSLIRLVRAAANVVSTNTTENAVICSLKIECVFGKFIKIIKQFPEKKFETHMVNLYINTQ
uniref:Uncharacterized protein n=1 Tax=Panagrolaimus superbus TaxID=310955 RepID=A0A914Z898_9BILA